MHGPLIHYEFLADDTTWFQDDVDPQELFIKSLLDHLEEGCEDDETGTILVYNKTFEDTRLKAIAKRFPKRAKAINQVRKRMVDLAKPFREMHVYATSMGGSYSLKRVLPAMVPDFEHSYSNLAIGEGGAASSEFLSLIENATKSAPEEVAADGSTSRLEIRQNLVEYCTLDTLAMVKILERFYEIVDEEKRYIRSIFEPHEEWYNFISNVLNKGAK